MELKELVYIDDLTGIYNRRAFRENLEKDLKLPLDQLKNLYLVLTDLDHFKSINDTYGHLSGDFMIKEFSRVLVEGLKGSDSLIARYGGDEFVVILRRLTRDKALVISDQLRQNLAQTEFILPENAQRIRVTASIGISEYPGDGRTPDDLFSKADEALYSSKQLGRNRVTLAKDILAQVKEEKRIQNVILKPPFVGRFKEIGEIEKFLFGEAPNKLVLISGDVGQGKSRMLEELTGLAKAKKRNTFFLTCIEAEKDKPYSILVDIVNAISYNHYEECKKAFDSLEPKQKAVISALPKLKILTGASGGTLDWNIEARTDLFHGISELFEAVCCELTPVILIDNIDWIDEASAEAVSYLIVSKKHVPVCICGSDSRPPNLPDRKRVFLDDLLLEISEFEIVPRINLQPLTEAQARALLDGIFAGIQVPQHFLDNVFQTTKGNPFFIVELLRDLLTRRVVYLKSPEWIFNEKRDEFPRDLKELLLNKFKDLEQEERELLLAAAGLGGNFKFDFLSKLKKINSGYAQDIIGKAVEKNIFNKEEISAKDILFFNNESTRLSFYESLDEEAKKKMHLDIATTIESENRDNIEAVSTELAFHFDRAKIETKVKEYTNLALKYIDKIFSDAETEKIIEAAVREREEKDRFEPIKEECWPVVIEIISAFNSAVKSMHLYQGENEVTEKMVQRCFDSVEKFFKLQNNLTFSNPQGEAKDYYTLLINGQEFHVFGFMEQLISRRLVDIMREFNIGSITLRKSITKKEIVSFISIIADPKRFAERKENWQNLLVDNKVSSINIDEVLYKRVLSEEEKKQFHKDFIKDFVSKKVVADGMGATVMQGEQAQAGGEATGIERKIIGVTRQEKNVLAKTISHMPVNVVVDTVANEYSNRKNTILDIKDMVSVFLKNTPQRTQLVSLLQSSLLGLGMSKECLEWLVDETDFSKHPVEKRANMYLNTDAKSLLEMGVTENLIPALSELFNLEKDEVAQEIVEKYLSNLQSAAAEFRVYMSDTLLDVVNIIPARVLAVYLQKVSSVMLGSLSIEKEEVVYEHLTRDITLLVPKMLASQNYRELYSLLSIIQEHARRPASASWRQGLAQKALQEMNDAALGKQLLGLMDRVAFERANNDWLVGIVRKLMPYSLPNILELLLNRPWDSQPFEWYMQDLKLIDVLREYKKDTVNELEKMFEAQEKNKIGLAFDILRYFRDEKLLYLYEKPLNSQNSEIRIRAIDELVQLDLDASLKVLEEIFFQVDEYIQKDIIARIGEHSRNMRAVEFLSQITDAKGQGHRKKEIRDSIEKIQKRIGS